VEVPPGPPVLSTVVAEIYSKYDSFYQELINGTNQVKSVTAKEPFVMDIKILTEETNRQLDITIDREKAALNGIDTKTILEALDTVIGGKIWASFHLDPERNSLWIRVILPRKKRSDIQAIHQISVKSSTHHMIPLAELVKIVEKQNQKPVYHKTWNPWFMLFPKWQAVLPGKLSWI
jgi:multidrug efflux pump subunit AcrB